MNTKLIAAAGIVTLLVGVSLGLGFQKTPYEIVQEAKEQNEAIVAQFEKMEKAIPQVRESLELYEDFLKSQVTQ